MVRFLKRMLYRLKNRKLTENYDKTNIINNSEITDTSETISNIEIKLKEDIFVKLPSIKIPDYSNLSDEDKIKYNKVFELKFTDIKKFFPDYKVPDNFEKLTLNEKHLQFELYNCHININKTFKQYRCILMAVWIILEAICSVYYKSDIIDGFYKSQKKIINEYDNYLLEIISIESFSKINSSSFESIKSMSFFTTSSLIKCIIKNKTDKIPLLESLDEPIKDFIDIVFSAIWEHKPYISFKENYGGSDLDTGYKNTIDNVESGMNLLPTIINLAKPLFSAFGNKSDNKSDNKRNIPSPDDD